MFRHPQFFNESILTSFGELKTDGDGFIVNQQELGISDEDMATIPGLLNNDDFPIEAFPVRHTVAEAATAPAQTEQVVTENTEQTAPSPALAVVEELLTNPDNFNSQGNLDMQKLNDALVAAGLERVNGQQRDELVAAVKAQ